MVWPFLDEGKHASTYSGVFVLSLIKGAMPEQAMQVELHPKVSSHSGQLFSSSKHETGELHSLSMPALCSAQMRSTGADLADGVKLQITGHLGKQ